MKRTLLWALAALNVLLVVVFVSRITHDNSAMAQAQGVRRPGDYLLVPAEIGAGWVGLVYVIDEASGQLGALSYDDARNALDVMPAIDLGRLQGNAPGAPNPQAVPGARRRY